MLGITTLLSSVAGMATNWLAGRSERARVKLDGDIALAKAKTLAMVDRMHNKQSGDIAWENLSISNSGWKDEWFTVLLSIPMVMCFVPGGAQYVQEGFAALNASTPEWYQYAFLVAVGSSFGVRKLTDFMKLRKGA